MSLLKAQQVVVKPQYVNTYTPLNRCIKQKRFLLWAETSKGWFYMKRGTDDEALASKMVSKIVAKGKINTTHWEAV